MHWICRLLLARWHLYYINLPTYQHGRSFNLLRFSSVSFVRDLKTDLSLVWLESQQDILLCDYCEGCCFLNFFLSQFILWEEEGYWFELIYIHPLCWSCLSSLGVLWWNFGSHLSILSYHLQIVILWLLSFQFASLWCVFVV